tara:strand:- start:777 stop:1304 length:528 start_codon:yes stop_codon:yes gene_type:complete
VDDCPPRLVVFQVERETADGITTSAGRELRPTREVVTKYRDNRTSYDGTLWLAGTVDLTNHRRRRALVKYRHEITLDFWLVPRISHPSPVCYEDGVVVGYWCAYVEPGETVQLDIGWSVDLFDRADFDRDGFVDAEDLALLLAAWGRYDVPEDLNQDGVVNGFDLGWFFTRWSEE